MKFHWFRRQQREEELDAEIHSHPVRQAHRDEGSMLWLSQTLQDIRVVFRLTLAVIWLCGTSPQAGDWPRFRGPNGAGVTDAHNLPVDFGPARNVVWNAAVPPGHSSPVVTRDRIFLTAYEGQKLFVICLERSTGKELWKRSIVKTRSERKSQGNDPATPTPSTDGKNVYAFFSDFGLISYDRQGAERRQGILRQPGRKGIGGEGRR